VALHERQLTVIIFGYLHVSFSFVLPKKLISTESEKSKFKSKNSEYSSMTIGVESSSHGRKASLVGEAAEIEEG
jgi:alkyl hydroperoxide reductase subunit AhpC